MRVLSLDDDIAAIGRIGAVPTILRTIAESTGLRVTLVARVLPDRWVACAVHDEIAFGLKVGSELDVATTLCSEVRESKHPVVIDHASNDPVYSPHATPKMYGFESYIAVPIFRQSGEYFGNVCGLDPLPRILSDGKTLSMMRLFSELISLQLDAEERHARGRHALEENEEAARLREEFIAVLGHDVRNPLGSIAMGADILLGKVADPADRKVLERVRSSTRRIGALVDDLQDLARGRLGGGITVDTAEVGDLAARLAHVVAEVQAVHADRPMGTSLSITKRVRCDPRRIEQLLSNLLANAFQHGSPTEPIDVTAHDDGDELMLQVSNGGQVITDQVRQRLFKPYFRAGSERHDGLGLGLYIASEIAGSHGGRLDVASTPQRTRFTFTMPLGLPSLP